MIDQFLTPSQACERLAIGRTTLDQEIKAGRLVVLRVGRCVRISSGELGRWISERLSVRPKDRRAA